MIQYDNDRMRQAVQLLVDSHYFSHHLIKIRANALKPRALPFKDKLEVLNELLIVGRQSLEAMENLIQVAQFKRSDRNDYQRQFMANKRKREKLVVTLAQLLTGRQLNLDERLYVIALYAKAWHAGKAEFLKTLGAMTWEDKNAHQFAFWQLVDAEIEDSIREAQQQPARRKPSAAIVSGIDPVNLLPGSHRRH